MSAISREPSAYSRLNNTTGKIEWVYPGDKPSGAPVRRVRTRLETDDEVRIRLHNASQHISAGKLSGRQLDDLLLAWSLELRKWIDEVQ